MKPIASSRLQRARTRSSSVPAPVFRRLKGYAFDPSLSLRLDTAIINEIVFEIPWEELKAGPVGEYLEIVDRDPASGCYYAPADLSNPLVLAQDGLSPSEGNPQFHQQMVYAVAMVTIRNFEQALGRWAFWSPHRPDHPGQDDFVQRLRIYPHALREANAYYSPDKKALLFGYFPATSDRPGDQMPGGLTFTCLSHDIIAHETTHALLDGMHQRFIEPTNEDSLAFHEAFADIVALFQHFTFPELLKHQIAKTRGDLARQNLLGELAQQFGRAIGNYGALRDAIGGYDEKGQWSPQTPDPEEYQKITEPHARGALLVAAVFDAFIAIYKYRVADLLRIATAGSGILPEGALHPDLVNRLADEASRTARHVLTMCIRALDYCPPVDITFGDYLRAIITADCDALPRENGYRIAFIDAFRRRGIYPQNVRTLSVDNLRWPEVKEKNRYEDIASATSRLRTHFSKSQFFENRREAFTILKEFRAGFHEFMKSENLAVFEPLTGLVLAAGSRFPDIERDGQGNPKFEIHAFNTAQRVGPEGSTLNQAIISITQKRRIAGPGTGEMVFRGGCTLIIDLDTMEPRYAITKAIDDTERMERQRQYQEDAGSRSLHAVYFGSHSYDADQHEPFALLHRDISIEE